MSSMATRQQCLYNAAELVRIAQGTDDPDVKSILIEMANGWRKLAELSPDAPDDETPPESGGPGNKTPDA